ncbi:MAG: chromophore lyase CpcT/CpeT [Leptolyngbyaceae cyanobacterium]|jgi:hypothetical protein
MTISADLRTLAHYLAGEFDNREQAIAEPAWFVHLRLWHRPLSLFSDDSLTLFAEQASVVNLDHPYRQRLLRLQVSSTDPEALQVQYYSFKDPEAVAGAGQKPELLKTITLEQIELLPGCILKVISQNQVENTPGSTGSYRFIASPLPDTQCSFIYQGETRYVSLGFEVSATEFLSYDKGIDLATGKALWGAILGPYRYTKRENYDFEF